MKLKQLLFSLLCVVVYSTSLSVDSTSFQENFAHHERKVGSAILSKVQNNQKKISLAPLVVPCPPKLHAKAGSGAERNRIHKGLISSDSNDVMTINESGVFKLNTHFTGRVSITASDVVFDMQGFTVSGASTPLIFIAAGVENIIIKNGTISGNDTNASQRGIQCGTGVTGVTIEDMQINDCMLAAIDVIGSSGAMVQDVVITNCQMYNNGIGIQCIQVKNAAVENCEMVSGNTGMRLNSSSQVCVHNCNASCNTAAGFALLNSTHNIFTHCKSIDNGSDADAYGYFSQSGMCNTFDNCIAQSTQTTGIDPFYAAGFSLIAETNSKIAHCQAGNGSGAGIFVGPLNFTPNQSLINAATLTTIPSVNEVSWLVCGDSKYLATGRNDALSELGILQFNASVGTLTQVFDFNNTGPVNSVDWLVCGDSKYLAIGAGGPVPHVRVFSFDIGTNVLSAISSATYDGGLLINSVVWQMCGDSKYLAIGGIATAIGNNADVEVLKFDDSAGILSLVGSASFDLGSVGTVNSLDWLVCGADKYIAVGSGRTSTDNEEVRVFQFDDIAGTLISLDTFNHDSLNVLNRSIFSVNWLVCGASKYLVIGGGVGDTPSSANVRVLQFDVCTKTLSHVLSSNIGGQVNSVDSFVCDATKYIAIGRSLVTPGVEVFEFDSVSPALNLISTFAASSVLSVKWQICGDREYLGVGDINGARVLLFDGCPIQSDVSVCNVIKKNHITNNVGIGLQDDALSSSTNKIYGNFACKNGTNYSIGSQFPIAGAASDGVGVIENIDCSIDSGSPFQALKYTVVDQAAQTCTKLNGLLNCAPTLITGPTALSSNTSYCLANTVGGAITMTSVTNVALDLNGFRVRNILVSSSSNIIIRNGIIRSSSVSIDGLDFTNSSDVLCENLQVTRNREGLRIRNNSFNMLFRCCTFNENQNTGMFPDTGSRNLYFEQCTANSNNAFQGFAPIVDGTQMVECQGNSNPSGTGIVFGGNGVSVRECSAYGNSIGFRAFGPVAATVVGACFAQGNTTNYTAGIFYGNAAASTASGTSAPAYWSNVNT